MLLFNPLYFITNVVFVDTVRQYVRVDKECWNNVMSLLFKNRRPNNQEIQSLKSLFYTTYIIYMNTQEVNYSDFSLKLAKLQGISSEDILESKPFSIPLPKDTSFCEVELTDQALWKDDLFLEEVPLEQEAEFSAIKKKLDVFKIFEDELKLSLNLMLSKNKLSATLIELCGYGRLLSIFKILFLSGEIVLRSVFEVQFLENNLSLLSDICKYQTNNNMDMAFCYMFYCPNCRSVGSHKFSRTNFKTGSNVEREICQESVRFFDKNGEIDFNGYVDDLCNVSISKGLKSFSLQLKSTFQQYDHDIVFSKETNCDFRKKVNNFVHIIHKIKEFNDKYDELRNEVVQHKVSFYDKKLGSIYETRYYSYKSYVYIKESLDIKSFSFYGSEVFDQFPIDYSEFCDDDFEVRRLNDAGFFVSNQELNSSLNVGFNLANNSETDVFGFKNDKNNLKGIWE